MKFPQYAVFSILLFGPLQFIHSFFYQWLYNPLLGPDLFFSFVNLSYTVSRLYSLNESSARRKAATHTQDNTNTEKTHTQEFFSLLLTCTKLAHTEAGSS
jgi:hypothetical protein